MDDRHVIDVVPLDRGDTERAAGLLTRAFAADGAWRTIFPDGAERERAMPRLWRAVVGVSQTYGEVWTTPDIQGVACVLTARHASVTPWREMRTGFRFTRLIAALPAASRRSFLSAGLAFDRLQRQAMTGPHAYLWALGVNPDQQRRGIGRSLLSFIAARADAAKMATYLETQSERTVQFYRGAGFSTLTETSVLDDRIHVWGMGRRPREAEHEA